MLRKNHDSHFKRFFSSKEIVKALMEFFIPPELTKKMNLDSLEPFPTEHIGLDNRKRFNDIVWKATMGESTCFILIMLEFQSSSDWWMALRINEYSVMLLQDYIKAYHLKRGDLLPPIFPIVIYSNKTAWRAPISMKDLAFPVNNLIEPYQPQQSFYLIDIGKLPEKVISQADNLVAAIFKFERIGEKGGIMNALAKLCKCLPEDSNPGFHEMFLNYLRSFIIKDEEKRKKLDSFSTVQEVYAMLSDLAPDIETFFTNKGIKEGISIGREEGISIGKEEGISIGREEGIIIGKIEAIRSITINILTKKFGALPEKVEKELKKFVNDQNNTDVISWAIQANHLEEFESLLSSPNTNNERNISSKIIN